MANELLALAAILWAGGGALALTGRALGLVRAALALGALGGIAAAIVALPGGTAAVTLPFSMAGEHFGFRIAPEGLWLMGFGLAPTAFATLLGCPVPAGRAGWLFGAAASLLGALGVFGIENAGGFLVAWEVMSLGGAAMVLWERATLAPGAPVLFMLGLLEVGAVALLIALLALASASGGLAFAHFAAAAAALPGWVRAAVGVLLVIGFGAKLGLLPFYEWFPGAYGAGSGASGVILSGVVLNAAFFALSRGVLAWLSGPGAYALGIFVVILGVLSAILAALYAFQQDDWRGLLSFSSAENAAIAVTTLGAALMFRAGGLAALAGLAWTVSLLHLAGHALAKGTLFLTADGVFAATGRYEIRHSLLAKRSALAFGAGALFAAMSLAAMPPQAGFVSEWFVFQTVFQGFHLSGMGGRLVLALAGAGLALTAAVAFATFIKLFGIGLLGSGIHASGRVGTGTVAAVATLCGLVLALAVGMPLWLSALNLAAHARFGAAAPAMMHVGPLLVPLTAGFAFISPTLLVIVMPLLSLLPLGLLHTARAGRPVRRVPVWYGGSAPDVARTVTTALTFSNALRTFYSFVYRPTAETTRETAAREYFVTKLSFSHDVAPVFGPFLFAPAVRLVRAVSARLRVLQSGQLNFYLGLIGLLLVIILGLTLIQR
ncbi:MAG: proton-conducting transporter membrane subunit [Rhodospirillales bacterium]|nr:proton-conducting transporter membrane subunit [Rhodospirillales bacterium]